MILLLCEFKSIPSVPHREFSCLRSLLSPSLLIMLLLHDHPSSSQSRWAQMKLLWSPNHFWGLKKKHRKDLLAPAVSSLKTKKEWESFKQAWWGKVGAVVQGTGFHLDKCSCLTSTTQGWWETWCHAEFWEGLPTSVQWPMCGGRALGFSSPDPSFSVPYTLHLEYGVFCWFLVRNVRCK